MIEVPMNNLSLRMRLTLLTGCIFIVVTILLTLLSIYSAEEKIVQPITSSLLNQENSLHKEIMDESAVETKMNQDIVAQIKITDVREAKKEIYQSECHLDVNYYCSRDSFDLCSGWSGFKASS
ncbi:hypothetical protein OL548_03295 [Lysinibacillus sp. MHQ-1]|nr:hypothetical protein OL548_03295 [Lysinibacillus sp. MHQ-1]